MPASPHTLLNAGVGRGLGNSAVQPSLFTTKEIETQVSCPGTHTQLVAELRLEAGLLTLGVLHFLFLSFRMVPAGSSFCLDPPVLYSLQVLLTHK